MLSIVSSTAQRQKQNTRLQHPVRREVVLRVSQLLRARGQQRQQLGPPGLDLAGHKQQRAYGDDALVEAVELA